MRIFAISFLLGILILAQFTCLPNKFWLIPIILFGLICFKDLRMITGICFGFAWGLYVCHSQWILPNELEGKNVTITGYIASIPAHTKIGETFLFSAVMAKKALIKLSYRNPNTQLKPGDKWKLTVRLKHIHGVMNPGGFDYEAWALQEGIDAQGYVVTKGENKLIDSHWYHTPLNRFRAYLQNKIETNLPVSTTSPWINALIVGERHNIDSDSWEVLRKTGTNHLMAIAGLHIGLVASFFYFLIYQVWRRIPYLVLKMPAQHAGAIASLLIALIYAGLSGFSLPAERACIMLMVFIIFLLSRRQLLSWHAWSTALLIVLLLNPMSVLSESFWLSFGAVALIIYGVSGRLAEHGLWWKWGRIQWVLSVGLIPLGLWLFQQCSFISFIANSIAIPWMGFLILPLCLFGGCVIIFSQQVGHWILIFADKLLTLLWKVLFYLSQVSWGSWYHTAPHIIWIVIGCIGVLLLLFPAGFRGRYLGFIWLMPMFLCHPALLKEGDVIFTLLDVGQGLSAVLQTKNHVLVYDAGSKLNIDMGESVVIPFLHTLNIKTVDKLVISHGDNDHIGGAYAIIRNMKVKEIQTSVPERFSRATYCLQGQSWEWDHVTFQYLYPTQDKLNLDNNSSCVLRITASNHSILLTGDIEKLAEQALVKSNLDLSAYILVAPHHGSKTSAEESFIEAVHPHYVLYPVGYRNRYHFPNLGVINKYNELGSLQFDTATYGAIKFKISDNKCNLINLFRLTHDKFWNIN